VTHTVWRISTDTPSYGSDDLSGIGADLTGGRWNKKGTALLYAAGSIALACLETVVHLGGSSPLPLNRYLVQIDVPADAWKERIIFDPVDNIGWDALPEGLISIDWAAKWANSRVSLLAQVPSVVVPEETNVLINPKHPDASKLMATKLRRWTYDTRLP
jgi:RES domain-containing protein